MPNVQVPERLLINMERTLSKLSKQLTEQAESELISEEEAAKLHGVGLDSLRNMVYNKTIPPVAIKELHNGKRLFIKSKLFKN